MAGIYIHIPFCKQACYYCDFHFSTNQELKEQLCEAIVEELKLQQHYLENEPIETIYFGGGTPSLLSESQLRFIIDSLFKHFPINPSPEITLEANPDDLSMDKLRSLKSLGVNRLSIGIQSFQDEILKKLHRSHQATEARLCVLKAQDLGIENISIDLIFSIPGQTMEMLASNLEEAQALNPKHLSVYSLTIEEKTVFGKWTKAGSFNEIGDQESAEQFDMVMEHLQQNGYEHYEISNYCLPGFHSRHNSSYWQQKKYLGVGPSAHSYNGVSRQHNIANNSLYIKSLKQGIVPFEKEILTRENKINEYIFTTLRTTWGCSPSFLMKSYGYNIFTESEKVLQQLLANELILKKEDGIFLTQKGKRVADQVASALFTNP